MKERAYAMPQTLKAPLPFPTPPPDGQESLADLVARWAPHDGRHATPFPGLSVVRLSRPSARLPVVYKSCICFVAQGSKRAFFGDKVFNYDRQNYLVVSVPLPFETEIFEASPQEPFFSIALQIDPTAVTDLLLEIDAGSAPATAQVAQPGIFVSPLHEDLGSAVRRLMAALSTPMNRKILAPLAAREILYHVLSGEQGDLLRAVVLHDSRTQRIARVLRFLNAHYGEPLTISAMAREAHMSPSTLHHTFKEVTSVSPLQYLKQIRLHQARLLLMNQGLSAGEVAYRVGYNSPSQFSREFKRLFGAAPTQEIQRLREVGWGEE
jgi:AraC-like DNA-binding protein